MAVDTRRATEVPANNHNGCFEMENAQRRDSRSKAANSAVA